MGKELSERDKIGYFLEPPEESRRTAGIPDTISHRRSQSILYLLRGEIKETGFGVNENTCEASLRKKVVEHRLFATAMLIFAGIDLLAKFVYGDKRDKGKVGRRFKVFSRCYMGLSKDHAERLWAVRNAMMHSFGLYTSEGFRVMFTNSLGLAVVETLEPQVYLLSLSSLYDGFLDAVAKYEERVRSRKVLKRLFERMEGKYGFMSVEVRLK